MQWDQIISWTFLATSLGAGLRLMAPILVASLGGLISERAGVINLALEGLMYVGAVSSLFAAAAGMHFMLALAVGMASASIVGVLQAWFVVGLRADQVVTGVAITLLGQGGAQYVYLQRYGAFTTPPRLDPLPRIGIPLFDRIPVFGSAFFEQQILVWVSILATGLIAWLLIRTEWGLRIRAVGDAPEAVDVAGISVPRLRSLAVIIGCGFAGAGGALLILGETRAFDNNIVSGKGWLAVGVVIVARWKPLWCIPAAFLFGVVDAVQIRLQVLDVPIPHEFLLMAPFFAVLISLVLSGQRAGAPAALGRPYRR